MILVYIFLYFFNFIQHIKSANDAIEAKQNEVYSTLDYHC
jgi:hypothetical protein